MKLTALTSFLSRLEQISSLAGADGHRSVFGLLQAAKPAFYAAIAENSSWPLLIVTAHPQSAHELADELAFWTSLPVGHFPAIESLPYERVRLDRSLLADRETAVRDVASSGRCIVVASARSLLQPVTTPRASEPITVRENDQILPERLLANWVEAGYSDTTLVDEQGTFARRGGVIDVWPIGESAPVRIDLFGNDVESLRVFDPSTQRSTGRVSSVVIHPIAPVDSQARRAAVDALMALDTSRMTAEAEAVWLDDLARLEAGAGLDEVGAFLPYLAGNQASLIGCLPPNATVIVDSARETWHTIEDLCVQADDVVAERQKAGELPVGLKSALVSPDQVREGLARIRTIEQLPGTPEDPGATDLSALFLPAPLYAGRLRSFVHAVAGAGSERTIITSFQQERVAELLEEDGLASSIRSDLDVMPEPGVTLLPASLAEGWLLPSFGLTLLTDHELFGKARVRAVPRRTRTTRETFFADFSPGDYVVHVEHGIGRFESVTRMSIDGAEREYALVQYAGSDRVYVPTDQLERLTRYIGVGETPPPLSRLGGGEWQRARQRAKQAAEDIARELIDLYSKRMARPGFAFAPDTPWQGELETSFPYPETPDQLRAVDEIKSDMEAARPMDRLVCADVGYGKTEVAVRAAFKALVDGKQIAVLVPTTILAQQHFETFKDRLAAFPVRVEVLSRFRSAAEQRKILQAVEAGEVDVLIGTHRILQKDIHFKNLGLLIIDEEQRFGVKHKEHLRKLRETIDTLTLTATPIPRTLHMTLVGIREVSVIETPPEGRLPVKTYLQPFDERLLREAVLRELDRDGQVYLVHNRVATIDAMAERIRRLVPEARLIVAHGQMEERQLESAMLKFAHHEADVLICSTIIENGLDIPNVNTIVVNNAHTLGLTQLYQLRGRVGRSANQAYAYLLYPRDAQLSHDALRRMEAVFEAQELGAGFSIAMKDLEIRGAGNLLGAEQSGHAAAVGFDLYTRMVAEAVDVLRGQPVQEVPPVTLDVPLTMFLPAEYVNSESERLSLYRRLAAVSTGQELDQLVEEMTDRFGEPPPPVLNLVASIRLKLLAMTAGVQTLTVNADALIIRATPHAIYDRVSLYRKYGTEARISTYMLRVPRQLLGADWMDAVREILADMVRLRDSVKNQVAIAAAGTAS